MKKIINFILILSWSFFILGGFFSPIKSLAKEEYKPGEILVKLKSENISITENKKDFENGNSNLKILNQKFNIQKIEKVFGNLSLQNDKVGLSRIYKLKFDTQFKVEEVVQKYKQNLEVEWAEPNYIFKITATPNDPYYSSQWALPKISAPSGWDINTGSPEAIIAIVDTGVDYNHPDLVANMWTNTQGYHGYDFINNDNYPLDDQGHGTHCAGIASAVTNNSVGIAGVSWSSKIMAVKTFNSSGEGDMVTCAQGINYAVVNGAKIISMSWGGYDNSQTLKEALNNAYSQGLILVAGAGNNNKQDIFYPAGYSNVLAVAATDEADRKASFSNYGSWIDVTAPGTSIRSTYLNNTYQYLSGTSMACPHVAGLAALLKSYYSSWTNSQIVNQIKNRTDYLYYQTSGDLGTGRINIHKALANYPTVQTNTATNISYTSATLNGNITNTGGANCLQRGFDYRQQGATSWQQTVNSGSYEAGSYSINLSGILPGASYQFRAKAYNIAGWGYGSILNFVTQKRTHPQGTLIQVKSPYLSGEPSVYLIQGNQKRLIPDPYVYLSQYKTWGKIVAVSTNERDSYSSGAIWPYRDGELVKEKNNHTVYLFEEGKKRKITSASVFNAYKFSWNNILVVPDGSLSHFDNLSDLSSYSANNYPSGSLLKEPTNPCVYRIEKIGGVKYKRPFHSSSSYLSQYYSWNKIITVSSSVLASYPTYNQPVPYRDGELVKEKSKPEVYVFENGQKRWITNPQTFNTYGYSWSNVIIVPDNDLNPFSSGDPLSI